MGTSLPAWNAEAKFPAAAQVIAPGPLPGLHVADSLTDALTLEAGHGSADRHEHAGDPVAGDVAAEIDTVQGDAAIS